MDHLFPSKLKPVMLELSGISEEKKVNEISREERQRFVHLIKHFEMTLSGLRSYKEAIITKGGVNVKEIDPGTMESKRFPDCILWEKVLDLDEDGIILSEKELVGDLETEWGISSFAKKIIWRNLCFLIFVGCRLYFQNVWKNWTSGRKLRKP